jgi:hypothetical protein
MKKSKPEPKKPRSVPDEAVFNAKEEFEGWLNRYRLN